MRVAVALSGGVDSAVSALLLRWAGYDVVGVSFFHKYLNTDASSVAQRLGIPYSRIDMSNVFQKNVVDYFISEYLSGRTPNPCVYCNRRIKFGEFRKRALELTGADFFATGHYASIIEVSGRRLIKKSQDSEYEQSYFLCYLTQDELKNTLFPLSTLTKSEVRKIAFAGNLPVNVNRSSRDVCFAQEGYRTLFSDTLARRGDIVDVEGRKIGEHNGIFNYTVGQRRGLKTARGEPLYILRIETERNRIVVAPKEMVYKKDILVKDINYVAIEPPKTELRIQCRIRYRQPEQSATLFPLSETEAKIVFDEPVFAATPGQFAVFFSKDLLLGGGVIQSEGSG